MLDMNWLYSFRSPILPHIFLFKRRLEESKMLESGNGVVIFLKLIIGRKDNNLKLRGKKGHNILIARRIAKTMLSLKMCGGKREWT